MSRRFPKPLVGGSSSSRDRQRSQVLKAITTAAVGGQKRPGVIVGVPVGWSSGRTPLQDAQDGRAPRQGSTYPLTRRPARGRVCVGFTGVSLVTFLPANGHPVAMLATCRKRSLCRRWIGFSRSQDAVGWPVNVSPTSPSRLSGAGQIRADEPGQIRRAREMPQCEKAPACGRGLSTGRIGSWSTPEP